MIRIETIVRKALVLALPVASAMAIGAPRDARAQYAPPPPPPQYVAPPPPQYVTPPAPPPPQYVAPPAPPDAFIATSTPEYYEGRPVYLYNGNWYYRDEHGGWNYYRSEPQYLHDRRAVHEAPVVHDAPHDVPHDVHHEAEHHVEQPAQQQRYHYNH
jgi:hypothetical protein